MTATRRDRMDVRSDGSSELTVGQENGSDICCDVRAAEFSHVSSQHVAILDIHSGWTSGKAV